MRDESAVTERERGPSRMERALAAQHTFVQIKSIYLEGRERERLMPAQKRADRLCLCLTQPGQRHVRMEGFRVVVEAEDAQGLLDVRLKRK